MAGQDATRYQGLEGGLNRTIIEYRFANGGKTFRLIYQKAHSTPADEQVFEQVVKSFQFAL